MYCKAKRRALCLLFFLAAAFGGYAQAPALSFVFEEEKEGIRLYTAYDARHQLVVVRGEVSVEASSQAVLNLLRDSKRGHLWVNEVYRMETLAVQSDSAWVSRAFIHFPFPFKDRILVLKNILKKEPKGEEVVVQRVERDYYSASTGYVEILNAYGWWNIQSRGNGISKIIYTFAADVRVSLPAYVEKKMALAGMYGTLKRMRSLLEKPR